ncbi:hypothetical protein [Mesorhizobium sp. B2-3-10]|uniref:hypothetical protein n=1 Tax=Mesorhizobium sp. B2-3-10 TaxID=2589954 RepID=UPI001126453C|nr:hypothetical protein [Mesorhizobium sp. B2-3-10]TPL94767.1 hypothetical protein FJ943_25115 [Mesorhizobium sp. B2-3-10]
MGHLDPFTMDVTPTGKGAKTYKLHVSFQLHTFAREWRVTDTPDYRVRDGSDVRCFCPVRYKMSLTLPEMIRGTSKAYFSQDHNYLLFRPVADEAPYAVFFSMRKGESRRVNAVMTVVSAYQKENLPPKLQPITFATLVAKTSKGEEVSRP